MAAASCDYEWALTRIPQLEVDLGSAVSALEKAQNDNATLKDIHTDFVSAYKRLQEQHDRLRAQLQHDRVERMQLEDDHQQQIASWRAQLEGKARDFESLQAKFTGPREVDNIRMQLVEEIEEPLNERVRVLESRLSTEQQNTTETHRQMEALKMQGAARERDLNDEQAEQARRNRQREHELQRQVASLENEVRQLRDEAAASSQLKTQVHQQQTRTSALQAEMDEHEQQASRERAASLQELQSKVEEAAAARRRAHVLEAQLAQEERRRETTLSELDALRRENDRLTAQQAHLEAQQRTFEQKQAIGEDASTLQAELVRMRGAMATEREQHGRALQSMEEQHQAAAAATRRAESRARQLEEELAGQERDTQLEQTEAERRRQAELNALKDQMQKVEQDAELKRQSVREREQSLLRQLEVERTRAEALSDEQAQCRIEKDDALRAFREARAQKQQHEQSAAGELERHNRELASMRERSERAERERTGHVAAVEAANAAKRKEERRADAMQAELATVSQRLDEERARWAREADEAHSAVVKTEEACRSQLVQKMQKDHRRVLAEHQSSAKKALHKGSQKRQELRNRCHDLAKTLAQAQHEKSLAVRICEENRGAYELRLAEVSLAVGSSSRFAGAGLTGAHPQAAALTSATYARAESPGPLSSRAELRCISDSLERHTEFLRMSRASSASGAAFPAAGGGASPVARASLSTAALAKYGADGASLAKAAPKAHAVHDETLIRASTISNPQGQ